MKHLFIVNPTAGKGIGHEDLIERIIEAGKALEAEVNVYTTKELYDGYYYTKDFLSKLPPGSSLRVYSCGGDGSLNEIMNAMAEFSTTHELFLGCVPTGTGNDFVRNFQDVDFTDIKNQIQANSKKVDLIAFKYNDGKKEAFRRCINMFNIGFDCDVVYRTSILKKYPLLQGSMAYLMGILFTLIKKKATNLEIEFEDGTKNKGTLLMASIGNGGYCGGGLKGLPRAKVDDGIMDVSLVKNIPRRAFISLFPYYSKGTHLERPNIEEIVNYKQCKSLVIRPSGGSLMLCTDGEIFETGTIEFLVEPLALDFIVPTSQVK
ncbi:MAG: diacylglycerol kinase family protein [Anaerovoracaceae bacterium]|jgi:diacylglycerol kinase family enzyme|nr:diacylglycerol kinase family protein [Anaerovoracaceae bacterium]